MHRRTLEKVVVSQGAAGATDVVPAPGAKSRIVVVSVVLGFDAAGSYQWRSGTGPTNESGAIPVAANSGYVVMGTEDDPALTDLPKGAKLTLFTVTAKAFGYLHYFLDN